MSFPDPLTPDEIQHNFTIVRDPPPPRTFEIGLILGGTVSAGAYTAGFLDFFIQALDAWDDARAADARTGQPPTVPDHKVILDIVSGTSGGGVNASVMARAIAFDFPHATSAASPPAGNPFWDLWVTRFDIMRMLAQQDLAQPDPRFSLLDSTAIDEFAGHIINYGAGMPTRVRSWVRDPFRLILTLTNLRGVPYLLPMSTMGAQLGEYFIARADHARFAVPVAGAPPSPIPMRPYETLLPPADGSGVAAPAWEQFGEHAKGTAAFPLGFCIRNPVRTTDHYRWRVTAQPTGNNEFEIFGLNPAWRQFAGQMDGTITAQITTPVVDGGAMDNEPIELARTWLAGLVGRNPRLPDQATRAVVLVDPLASTTVAPPSTDTPVDMVSTILDSMISGARYSTSDLLLMADPNVFSRFLVTPSRGGVVGERAIAGGGFGAFMGFFSAAFRTHDFLKGRADCAQFLSQTFVMAADNPVFAGLNSDQLNKLRTNDSRYLKLIPLLGTAQGTVSQPDWPAGKFDPANPALTAAISARLAAVVGSTQLLGDQGWLANLALKLIADWGAGAAAGYVVDAIKSDLADWELS
jgi:hypothetical protein